MTTRETLLAEAAGIMRALNIDSTGKNFGLVLDEYNKIIMAANDAESIAAHPAPAPASMTEPVALFTQTDYAAERWTALMLLWGLGEVTLTTDDAGMFVVDFDSAESAERTWKGKGPEECLAEVIESFTSEHWDFDALPSQWAAATAVASRESGPIPRHLSHTHSRLRFPDIPHIAAAHPAPAPAEAREIRVWNEFRGRYEYRAAPAPAEHTAEAPAGVPDVAGLTHKLLYWARSSAENRPQAADAMREAADALAALQAQIAKMKHDAEMLDITKSELQSDLDDKIAQQAERINALTAKLAEAVELLCNAREELIEAIARLKGVGEVALAANDCSKDISEFLTKAREVMG